MVGGPGDARQHDTTRPPCRTCNGTGSITVKTHRGDVVTAKRHSCPVCRGTGRAGLVTK